jgi:hypothetical protein
MVDKITIDSRPDAVEEMVKQFETFLGAQKNDDPSETFISGMKVKLFIDGITSDVRQVNKRVISVPEE